MAVVFDAKSTQFTGDAINSFSDTSLTVGTGSNRVLLVLLSRSGNDPTLTCTWGGTTLTQVASSVNGFDEITEIWGLLNPVSGAQTLSITWLNNQAACGSGISFTGVEQSSLAAALTGVQNNTGTTGPAACTVASAIGDIVVSCQASVFCTLTEDNISIYHSVAANGTGLSANRATGAASVTLSATQSSAQTWAASGINVHAAASATVQLRTPFLSKLFSWPRAPVFQPYNLALYTVAVAQAPFVQTNWSKPFFPETPSLGSPSVNINLFTNPIPFGPYDYGEGPSRIPPFRPDATQPLNPNLFTNPIPFAKFDWFPVGQPPNSPPQALPYNINVFTNPIPFAKFDYPPVEQPPWSPPQAVPYNINIFTNPIPFAQFDWSHPFVPTPYFPLPTQALNLQLFTNPIPFFNFIVQPLVALPFFASTVPYNVPLYTVTVVAAPFAQYDWPITKMPRPQVDATRALNPNIFTNPFPFTPIDYSAITPRISRAPDQAYYNLNVYTVVVVAAPFVPINYSKSFFPRALLSDASQATSINLLPDPTLFMQVSWFGSGSTPRFNLPDQQPYNQSLYSGVVVQAPFITIDWSKPFFPRALPPDPQSLNIQLFTNPIPFFNLDLKGVNKPTGTPDLSVPYNVNLYGVVVVAPFAQYDWSKPFPPRPAPVQAQPFNLNLFTNSIPFAQFYWPTQFNVPQAQLNRSVQTNINLFTNPIPFVQNQYPGQRSVKLTPIPILPYNPNIYTVTVAGTTLHVVKFIGNMGHFMIR